MKNQDAKKEVATEAASSGPAEKEEIPLVEVREIDISEADVSMRYDDAYEWRFPDKVKDVRWQDDAYEFACLSGVALRIQVISNDIVRVRYSPDGAFGQYPAYAIDPAFDPKKPIASLTENDHEYVLSTEHLQVVVNKSDLRLRFFDSNDRLLCEDDRGYAAKRTVLKGWCDLQTQFKCKANEAFFGLGDKSCEANLAGKRFENWCTDAYGYAPDTDPLYRAIPFFFSIHQSTAYGIFLDNSFKTFFDFDSEEKKKLTIGAEGGELNYYFINGATPTAIVQHYAQLTGTHAMPPQWAIGYHQCRWSYYPDSIVRKIAETFRSLEIPCDAIYLDIDYMDGFRCFTWNEEHFPDPKGLIDELKQAGFQTVLMLDPGIKEDNNYTVYTEGVKKDHFLRTVDGSLFHAPVWPGFCAFPDFSKEDTRLWWGDQHEALLETGVAGFWNDMNEPAVFNVHHKTLPDHVAHHGDGFPGSHRQFHNTYGLCMTRASTEGLMRLQPEKRPFLLTRASYSGGQRYAAVWTGDNWSTWEHLQIANVQCQRLSVSGFSFCGTDIGGFAGETEPELFIRWLQLGVFHPLMRVHSMGQHISGDTVTDEAQLTDPELHKKDQEPWAFGDKWTDLAKKAIELRYILLPNLYTAFWLHHTQGIPVIRHGFMEDHENKKLLNQDRDFLFSQHIFVSPVVQPKLLRQEVHLPHGLWYYFWTGQSSKDSLFVNLMPDQIPFFVRGGAVLPIYPVRQHTGEPVKELTLYVYYNEGTEVSHLYEDEGEGFDYKGGKFRLATYQTEGSKAHFTLHQQLEGDWVPEYDSVLIYLVGFPVFAKHCFVNGEDMPIREIRLRGKSLYTLEAPPAFDTIEWMG